MWTVREFLARAQKITSCENLLTPIKVIVYMLEVV